MTENINLQLKSNFRKALIEFVNELNSYVSTDDGQWTIKGFLDVFQNIYTISADTKIVSKILEIHIFPKILEFSQKYGYKIVLTKHQNYYSDVSFVSSADEQIKFAVDFKTTYRLPLAPEFCNGFTLGSHGEYFINRNSTKISNFLIINILDIFVWESFTPEAISANWTKRGFIKLMN